MHTADNHDRSRRSTLLRSGRRTSTAGLIALVAVLSVGAPISANAVRAAKQSVAAKAGPPHVADGARINSKSPCQQVVFIGARGSGETNEQASGLGAPVYDAWLQYKSNLPEAVVGYYPVPYPAESAPAGVKALLNPKRRASFYASIDAGVTETLQFLRSRKGCSSEYYVLAGYSQGAMALERAAHWIREDRAGKLPQSTVDRFDGMLLIASGDRVASSKNVNYGTAPVQRSAVGISYYASLVPAAVDYKYDLRGRLRGAGVHEVCMRGDVVCDTDLQHLPAGMKVHGNSYSQWGTGNLGEEGVVYVRSAATNIAKRTKAWLIRPTFPGVETGRITFTHPTWGPVTLVTSFQESRPSDPYSSAGEGYITVVDAYGRQVWAHRTGSFPWYEMVLHQPAMDATGQIFIDWNPGRYNGVTVLQPVVGGFEDHRTLPDTDTYNGRFYYADVTDIGSDGVFEIAQHSNDCRPSCAGGTITTEIYHWNGSDYVVH